MTTKNWCDFFIRSVDFNGSKYVFIDNMIFQMDFLNENIRLSIMI